VRKSHFPSFLHTISLPFVYHLLFPTTYYLISMPFTNTPLPPTNSRKTTRAKQPRGPLDPPGRIATTLSQISNKKHMGTPRLPPIGFERQFKLKSILRDGGGDESLEVGVFRYKEGPGIGEFLFLSSSLPPSLLFFPVFAYSPHSRPSR
jgi:hypothetical protein